MCVRWGSHVSDSIYVSNGVRQGGILSPYLFSVYVDGLSTVLNSCNTGCYVGYNCVNNIMYADDFVVFCPSSRGLQTLLTVCDQYGVSHDIRYNAKKSMVMIIRNKSCKNVKFPSFMLGNDKLCEVESVKYLGHIISNSMLDDNDISRQCRQLYAQGNMIIRKFHVFK